MQEHALVAVRHVEQCAHVFGGHTHQVAQRDDRALGGWQPVDDVEQALAQLLAQQLGLGVVIQPRRPLKIRLRIHGLRHSLQTA